MKLKEDLVKRLREGYCTVKYEGENLEQLRYVLGCEIAGGFWGCYHFENSEIINGIKGEIIPLADFFESDMGELEEAVKVLEDNHFMEREVNQAIDVIVKHLKSVKKG